MINIQLKEGQGSIYHTQLKDLEKSDYSPFQRDEQKSNQIVETTALTHKEIELNFFKVEHKV